MIRITEDSNTQYIFNDTWVDSIGEIVDTPMNYPNSALVGLKVNSEQFGSSMPSRSYLVRGLKIRVPSNYNENTNTYIGVWDGTFKLLSSSNQHGFFSTCLPTLVMALGSSFLSP